MSGQPFPEGAHHDGGARPAPEPPAIAKLAAWLRAHPPPGPFRPEFWRSPLRGPWLTSVLGLVLLIGIPVLTLTGRISYAAYEPRLPGNDPTPESGWLGFYLLDWPTQPVWLYRVTQGTHVILGLTLLPVLLAKLWSVIPKLFAWPPARTLAEAAERASMLLLVGGAVFEFATGIMNIQRFQVFPFSFHAAHLYGAWVFLAAFAAHVVLKTPKAVRALRSRGLMAELRTGLDATRPEPPDPGGLVPVRPAEPTISRRGLLALTGGASLLTFALTVGQTTDGPLRRTALLAPHGRDRGPGPNGFPVNRTAAETGIDPAETGPSWRLELDGPAPVLLSRDELLAMRLYTYAVPIACVEGWSTEQEWTGVRLADLARLAGAEPGAVYAVVRSLERRGPCCRAALSARRVADPRSLLALRVNGADLSPDHGFPARIVVPNAPGVRATKWVRRVAFRPWPPKAAT